MHKPSPWEWHPSLIDDDLQDIAQSTICLLPFWQPSNDASNTYAYDIVGRKPWTGQGVYEPGDQGLYLRHTDVLHSLNSGFDYLGGRTAVTVTAAFDFNSPSLDDSSLLSTNWNTESILLWRNENRTTGQIRILLDVASTTIDVTSATNVGASGFNVASFRYDGATLNQFFNGTKDANSGSGTGAIDASSQGYRIGRGGTSDGGFLGRYYLLHIADRAFTDDEIAVLHGRIFDLIAPRDDAPVFAFGPVSSGTTVNATTKALTLTTHAASISLDRNIAATAKTLSLTTHRATVTASTPDEYADQGWAPRDFYSPYWMGMVPPREIEREAVSRATEARRSEGYDAAVPTEAAAIITNLAREQAEDSAPDELRQLVELADAIEGAQLEWQDHYGGMLRAVRDELSQAREARDRVRQARKKAREDERRAMEARARDELERRRQEKGRRQRNQRILATALLLSAA